MDLHLTKYIQELTNIRTQLEFEIIKLRNELEDWVSGRKQAGSNTGTSSVGSGEVHQTSTPPAHPGPGTQGPNTLVDQTGSQVTPVSSPSS